MTALEPQILAADLLAVRGMFATFFAARSPADWHRPTEPAGRGWTLGETVAHLDAVGQAYLQTVEAALAGRPYALGLRERTDLPTWNQREIQARASQPITAVCAAFLATLQQASVYAARLPLTALTQKIAFPAYQRPISLGELFAGLAAHPGLVHAAQVARGAGVAPLWVQYPPALLHRQITRFFHLMALSYWPERGGVLHAALTLNAAGPGGGSWHLTLSPAGCGVGEGPYPRPRLRLWFRNADVLCRVMTLQVSPVRALLNAQAFAWGDLGLGLRLAWLFNPA